MMKLSSIHVTLGGTHRLTVKLSGNHVGYTQMNARLIRNVWKPAGGFCTHGYFMVKFDQESNRLKVVTTKKYSD
ncbi:hypothetical protein NC651_038504 [Populus alba x Populus x berolinensis]|nr:hypothetical protein NC651_038504 [Populus alba x Populus x berolinensis]